MHIYLNNCFSEVSCVSGYSLLASHPDEYENLSQFRNALIDVSPQMHQQAALWAGEAELGLLGSTVYKDLLTQGPMCMFVLKGMLGNTRAQLAEFSWFETLQ